MYRIVFFAILFTFSHLFLFFSHRHYSFCKVYFPFSCLCFVYSYLILFFLYFCWLFLIFFFTGALSFSLLQQKIPVSPRFLSPVSTGSDIIFTLSRGYARPAEAWRLHHLAIDMSPVARALDTGGRTRPRNFSLFTFSLFTIHYSLFSRLRVSLPLACFRLRLRLPSSTRPVRVLRQ